MGCETRPAIRPERRLRLSETRADWAAPAHPRGADALSRRCTLRSLCVFRFRFIRLRLISVVNLQTTYPITYHIIPYTGLYGRPGP